MWAKPEVHLEDHWGSDLKVVNAARVSFGKRSDWVVAGYEDILVSDGYERHPILKLKPADEKLIGFLARGCQSGEWQNYVNELTCSLDPFEIEELLYHVKNMPTHWAPFAHCGATFVIKAPMFVARQLGKHQVGFVWSEESRRYVDDDPEFYMPDGWRKAAENVKQGSGDEFEPRVQYLVPHTLLYATESADKALARHNRESLELYNKLLKAGVCPEQARMVLPQNMMVNWWWTGSLIGFARVAQQRLDPHAQKETREVAQKIADHMERLFPVSWRELTK